MSTFEATLQRLPEPILNKLHSVVWRVRRLLLIRGIFATLAVGLLCVLTIMAIDAGFTIFSSAVRWGLSLTGLLITVAAGSYFLVRPLSRKLSLTFVARLLEIRHPELQERISTAVELLGSDDPDEIKGSAELIESVVDSAVLDVESVDPRKEFKSGRAARFVSFAAICLGVLALTLLIFPAHGWKLLTRAVAPHLNIGNAYADSMVIEPGDIRIVQGSELTIEMSVAEERLRRAELRRRLPDGSESVERMAFLGMNDEGRGQFSITFPGVEESFRYRVRAGAALSEYFEVTAIPAPEVEEWWIRYDYPEYTGLEAREEVLGERLEIRAVANTGITLEAKVNKEISEAGIVLNKVGELGATTVAGTEIRTRFALANGTNGTWQLNLTDRDGFASLSQTQPIQALPDKLPVVRMTNPESREMRLKPVEVLPFNYEIVEDFGISDMALLVTPNGADDPWVIGLDSPGRTGSGNFQGSASLDLSKLELLPQHNRLEVRLRARDNRPPAFEGPGEGVSDPLIIILDQRAKSLAQQTMDSQRKELEQAIRETRNDLRRAESEMRNAESELKRKDYLSQNAERDLKDFQTETGEARERIREVAERLSNSLFDEQVAALEELSRDPIAEARKRADLIPVTDEKSERVEEASAAREEIVEALKELDSIERSLRDHDDEMRAIAKLNEMANKQRELSQDAARLEGENRDERREQQVMNDFRRRQLGVQQELGQMLKDNAAALEEVLKEQQQKAEALARETEALAEEQDELRKLTEDAASSRANEGQEDALKSAILEELQNRQNQIAEEAGDMSKPTEDAELARAENEARRAADALGQEDVDQSLDAAQAAAEAMKKAGEAQQSGDKGDQPQNKPQPLADLAQRQSALAEQLAAVQAGELQNALAMMEAQVAEQSAELSGEADAMEDALRNLSQNQARYEAGHASNFMRSAESQSEQAERALSQAQQAQARAEESGNLQDGQFDRGTQQAMQRGQQEQERARRSMVTAINSLSRAAEMMGQTLEGMEPSEQDNRLADGKQMAESFEDLGDSAQSQDTGQASERSQQAAESLQQLAQQAMQQLGQVGDSQQQASPQVPQDQDQPPVGVEPNDGSKMADAFSVEVPPELLDLGISVEDWARFRGALAGGSAVEIDTRLPAEYRELVGRYFQVIAREAGGDN